MATGITTTITPSAARRWWRNKSRFDALTAHEAAYDATVYYPALDAVTDETAAIPHVETKASFETMTGERRHLSTASEADLSNARRASQVSRCDDANLAEYFEACAELLRAVEDRDAQRKAIYDRYQWTAIEDRVEKVAELQSKLQDYLIKTPAPDMAALCWKLDYLFTPHGQDGDQSTDAWAAHYIAQTVADWRRFLQPASAADGIEKAWNTLTLAHGAYVLLPETGDEDSAAEERIFLEAVQTCETRITEATATTPQGVLRQLQCAALHTLTKADAEKALLDGDFDTAEKLEASSNPHLALTFAAIRSLIAQGCVA